MWTCDQWHQKNILNFFWNEGKIVQIKHGETRVWKYHASYTEKRGFPSIINVHTHTRHNPIGWLSNQHLSRNDWGFLKGFLKAVRMCALQILSQTFANICHQKLDAKCKRLLLQFRSNRDCYEKNRLGVSWGINAPIFLFIVWQYLFAFSTVGPLKPQLL